MQNFYEPMYHRYIFAKQNQNAYRTPTLHCNIAINHDYVKTLIVYSPTPDDVIYCNHAYAETLIVHLPFMGDIGLISYFYLAVYCLQNTSGQQRRF